MEKYCPFSRRKCMENKCALYMEFEFIDQNRLKSKKNICQFEAVPIFLIEMRQNLGRLAGVFEKEAEKEIKK